MIVRLNLLFWMDGSLCDCSYKKWQRLLTIILLSTMTVCLFKFWYSWLIRIEQGKVQLNEATFRVHQYHQYLMSRILVIKISCFNNACADYKMCVLLVLLPIKAYIYHKHQYIAQDQIITFINKRIKHRVNIRRIYLVLFIGAEKNFRYNIQSGFLLSC